MTIPAPPELDQLKAGEVYSAWQLIGFDGNDGLSVRIKDGRARYELVVYNDDRPGFNVRLDRLEVGEYGLRIISRYVDPDIDLELVDDQR